MTASNLRTTGERIEQLLDDLRSHAPPEAWAKIEEAMRLITELYGAALARVVDVGGPDVVARLVDDDLVASLLIVHDLHPHDVTTRVENALASVRPYLGSHGGNVSLEDVDIATGVVRLRMLGSCDGCPSSAVTLKLAVERAIFEAAPEMTAIEVLDEEGKGVGVPQPAVSTPIALGKKPVAAANGWAQLDALPALDGGAVASIELSGRSLVVCRAKGTLYAYDDACPSCGSSLSGSVLDGEVLRCSLCLAAFDVRLAGRSLDGRALHLEPFPLLEGANGRVQIAVSA